MLHRQNPSLKAGLWRVSNHGYGFPKEVRAVGQDSEVSEFEAVLQHVTDGVDVGQKHEKAAGSLSYLCMGTYGRMPELDFQTGSKQLQKFCLAA
jgi:hypothetical protein